MPDHVQEALGRLQKELSRLEPAVKHIEQAEQVTASVSALPKLFEQQREAVEKAYKVKIEQYEAAQKKHSVRQEETLKKVTSDFEEQAKSIEISAKATIKAIGSELEAIKAVRSKIEDYHKAVVAVDFPTRLDKLDATTAGIMAATQTTQNRVDNLERATTEKLTAVSTKLDNHEKLLSELVIATGKANRSLYVVLVFLVISVLAAVAYLVIR